MLDQLQSKDFLARMAEEAKKNITASNNYSIEGKEVITVKQVGGDKDETQEDWPILEAKAYHGLAGEVVNIIDPTTEADPAAILAHFLVQFGNAIGRHAYCIVEDTRHYPNEFAVIVGDTSKARKGTAARRVERIMATADSDWQLNCIASGGLSSGEGIIHAVHDEIRCQERINDGKGKAPRYVEVVKHPGISDKRLFIDEPEFSAALAVMERTGSTVSRIIRMAWDSGNLHTLIKNNPERATGAHVSIIGHTTIDEYRTQLTRTEMVNGFANRFLNVLAKRSKELPFGGSLDDRSVIALADRIKFSLDNHVLHGEITFTPQARERWGEIYHLLSASHPGLYGAVTARAEAHTLRLALIYALVNGSRYIDIEHLDAALAFWRYCQASARYIFGDALGEPTADTILIALRQAKPDGLTRSDISNLFGRNKASDTIALALNLLCKHKKAMRRDRKNGTGRPVEIWHAR